MTAFNRLLVAAVVVALSAAILEGAAMRPADLAAGFADIDITPPVGYRMSGYFNERLATGTLNPLRAKAVVLAQGDVRAALVFADIIGLAPEVSALARRQIEARTGIPAASILIAATHSHTGPLYAGALRKHFHDLAVARDGKDACEAVDYPALLAARLAEAAIRADAARRPVRLAAGTAEQTGLAFNRRFHMKTGPVRFNPGPLNPDIVRPAGPVDPRVGMVFISDAAGKDLAAIVNFALHLDTTGGTLYAADYPYFIEETLRRTCGDEFLLLFGTGTCGDINHVDVTKKERPKASEIGATLGETVAAARPDLAPVSAPALAVRREVVTVPLQQPTPEKLAWAREAIHKVGTRDLAFLEQVEAAKVLDLELRGGAGVALEVQVMRLSADVAVVGLPGEVFVDLGLAIKAASPFATTLVIELCQDDPVYIPTRKAFEEGSYETVNSRIAPGGGEKMAEAAVRMLKELGAK
jgi:hypothetical protein